MAILAFWVLLSMAGDPFKMWSAGDPGAPGEGPFNSQWHNAVTDATRAAIRAATPGNADREVEDDRDPNVVWIANVSEATIDQYVAVGLETMAVAVASEDEFREQLCFRSMAAVAGRPFGITQAPIGKGSLYVCKEDGVGPGGQPPARNWLRLLGDAGAWDAIATYAAGEQVTHVGDVYASLQTHAGHEPTGAPGDAYWLLVGSHRGIWERDTTYSKSDVAIVPRLGRILLAGVSRAIVNVTQTTHQYAGVDDDGLLASQAEAGPLEILWRDTSVGEQWAVVRFCWDVGQASLGPGTIERDGSGSALLGAMTSAGVGTYIYRPGGALRLGAMAIAGVGAYSGPARSGSGSPLMGAMTAAGVGRFYDIPPSGRLNLSAMTAAGVGVQTTPPAGLGKPRFGAMTAAGVGTRAKPVRSGIGTPASIAMTCAGVGTSGPTSYSLLNGFTVLLGSPAVVGSGQ